MRLLYDAVLPQSLSHEAPVGVEFVRWDGTDVSDTDLARAAAEKGCRAVVLLGRDALEQPELRAAARAVGVALVTAATDNPVDAKRNILKNLDALRRELAIHHCLLVFAAEVRPGPMPGE